MNTIGGSVREYRLYKGFSLRQLASKVRISHTYLNDIEEGNRAVTWKILYKLIKYLDIPEEVEFKMVIENSKQRFELPPLIVNELINDEEKLIYIYKKILRKED